MQPKTTLLIATSNPLLRQRLVEAFGFDGYSVRQAGAHADVKAKIDSEPITVLVLGQLGDPGHTMQVLQAVRREQPNLLIVALAGGQSELHRVRPMEGGADTVAPAECSFNELRAHVRSVLERAQRRVERRVDLGPLHVDRNRRSVTLHGAEVALTAREYDLLAALAANPERVFTKEELLREVWGFAAQGATRTLDSHACRLRRKLEPANGSTGPRFVQNVWGVGYRLVDPQTSGTLAAAAV